MWDSYLVLSCAVVYSDGGLGRHAGWSRTVPSRGGQLVPTGSSGRRACEVVRFSYIFTRIGSFERGPLFKANWRFTEHAG